jgi:hypothetical protein
VTSETPNEILPAWFDAGRHVLTDAGIVRLCDRALLAEDGLPASLALRAAEDRDAKAAATDRRAAKAAKTPTTETTNGDQ